MDKFRDKVSGYNMFVKYSLCLMKVPIKHGNLCVCVHVCMCACISEHVKQVNC